MAAPKYLTRTQWGARAPKAVAKLNPAAVAYVHLHHSTGDALANPDAAKWVRGIQDFHMGPAKDWNDIAYSFLVHAITGDVYQGRGWDVVGGHTYGFNSRSIGVCILGNGDSGDHDGPPSANCLASVRDLFHLAQERYGPLERRGHRDDAQTHCPGDAAYVWWKGRLVLPAGAVGFNSAPAPTPKPAPDADGPGGLYPVAVKTKSTIKVGSTGATVKGWQTVLQVTADGEFGPVTEQKTKAFQAFFKLTADGVVGPKTWAVAVYLGLVK